MDLAPARSGRGAPSALAAAIGLVLFAGILVLALDDPIAILGAMGVAAAVLAVMNFPFSALLLLLFLEPFHSAIKLGIQHKAGLPVGPLTYWKDALIVVLFVRGIAQRFLSDRRLNLGRDAGDYLLVFYVFAYVAMAVTSPSRGSVAVSLGLYVEGPLLFLAIRYFQLTRRQLAWCIVGLLTAATVMAAGALIEQLGSQARFVAWYGGHYAAEAQVAGRYRAGSFFTDYLVLAFYLAGAAPLAAAVATIRARWRPAALLTFALCVGGVLVTLSRAGYIGAGIGIVLALLLAVRNPAVRVSLVGGALVVAFALSLQYFAPGNQTFSRTASNSLHITRVEQDLSLVAAKPFGYGLGSTDRPARVIASSVAGATENIYMGKAIDGGVQALVLYLVVVFLTGMRLRSSRRRALRAGDARGVALTAGALGAMAGVAVAGMFLGVDDLAINIVFWGAAAVALSWPISDATVDLDLNPGAATVAPVA